MESYGVHIDGATRQGRGVTSPLVEPATGEPFAELAAADETDLDEAVSSAARAGASSSWRTRPPIERARVLNRAAEAIRDATDEIATAETRNVGRPINETRANVQLAADDFAFFASLTTHLRGATVPMGDGLFDYTRREPFGVCGLIIPWNNPLNLFSRKVAPALAAGNAVVVKPSEATPISALMVAEILTDCGLPPGLINIVPGSGTTVGTAMLEHPGIAKVSFTGATSTGKHVMRQLADRVVRVSLELGGKSPSLVFADADLDAAVAGSLSAMFVNAGQTCTARSRILVEDAVYDEFIETFAERVDRMRVGDPFDDATQIGPLISQHQLDTVTGYLERGRAEGARVVAGGGRPDDPELDAGFYLEPTIFVDVHDRMDVVCEEIFGPVVVVDRFGSEDEAVERSNDTRYGLAATVWTQRLDRAHRMAARLQAGTVTVNTTKVSHAYAPFGGYKESGLGRELGVEGLDEYLQTKNVVIAVDE